MLIELINNFVAKFIFNQAASVCFLVAVTPQHIANARGQKLRQLIRVLNMMCKPELNFIKDSVIPVLTKVKPGDEEVDLDEVRSNIDETLQEEKKTDQLLTELAERLNVEGTEDGDSTSGNAKSNTPKSSTPKSGTSRSGKAA